MKTESSGHSARSILRDSEAFANLLRFYDGICQWEEDSLTPILHIGWAKPLVNNITKFDYDIRSQVVIKVPEEDEIAREKKQLFPTSTEATTSSLRVLEVSITEVKSDQDGSYSMNNNILKIEEVSMTLDIFGKFRLCLCNVYFRKLCWRRKNQILRLRLRI